MNRADQTGGPPAVSEPDAASKLVLDDFQRAAIGHLDAQRSVLVSAPTGSGKTLVAEHAIDRALAADGRAFYTTPIKALSNQKYRDLALRLGSSRVGLLTGDNAINADAAVVVMTTEVLRNMLYRNGVDKRLGVVVLDEVHYLADTYRGPVWEEVILHLPRSVRLVCLSATVSNHDELGGWLQKVRGEFGVVAETRRPVPLTNLYAVSRRRSRVPQLLEVLVGNNARPNPAGAKFDVPKVLLTSGTRHPKGHRGRNHRGASREVLRRLPWQTPRQDALVAEMGERELLPAIWFTFSRAGCDKAAARLAASAGALVGPHEAEAISAEIEKGLAGLSPADREALHVDRWADMVRKGVAAHHAGLVPAFKEILERCFAAGHIKVVFATETLALGINMPARSVVIEKLSKFNGIRKAKLTPAEYSQLSGRAGRRGIDSRGHALVLWSPFVRFAEVANLVSSRSFRLESAFRPNYNMVANLLGRMSPEGARDLMERSFGQYQQDRSNPEPGHRAEPGGDAASQGRPEVRQAPRPRRRRSKGRDSMARRFDAVAGVLRERGHLNGWSPSPSGDLVSRVYHERDLVIAEVLQEGLLDELSAPELAAVLSTLVYEHRSAGPGAPGWVPSERAWERIVRITEVVDEIIETERRHHLPLTRPADTGFAAMAYRWAEGADLHELLPESGSAPRGRSRARPLSAGEFVRNVKQIVDLARTIAAASPKPATSRQCRKVAAALNRGVVEASGHLQLAPDPITATDAALETNGAVTTDPGLATAGVAASDPERTRNADLATGPGVGADSNGDLTTLGTDEQLEPVRSQASVDSLQGAAGD